MESSLWKKKHPPNLMLSTLTWVIFLGVWVWFFLITSPPTDFVMVFHHHLCDQHINFSILKATLITDWKSAFRSCQNPDVSEDSESVILPGSNMLVQNSVFLLSIKLHVPA